MSPQLHLNKVSPGISWTLGPYYGISLQHRLVKHPLAACQGVKSLMLCECCIIYVKHQSKLSICALLGKLRVCCCCVGDFMYKGSPHNCLRITQIVLILIWNFDLLQFVLIFFLTKKIPKGETVHFTFTYSSVKSYFLLWIVVIDGQREREKRRRRELTV